MHNDAPISKEELMLRKQETRETINETDVTLLMMTSSDYSNTVTSEPYSVKTLTYVYTNSF